MNGGGVLAVLMSHGRASAMSASLNGRDRRSRPAPWRLVAMGSLILVMAVALPRDFRSLHRERAGHKAAGYWLREHAKSETIVDRIGAAQRLRPAQWADGGRSILGPVNTHFMSCDELLRFRTRRDDRRVLVVLQGGVTTA